MRRSSFLTGALCLVLALPAQAQTGARNRAAAEALFNEGRALLASNHFAEACPKFEASEQLDPGLGTMLNLAECYEAIGKSASAWAEYRDALPLARDSGSKAREKLASERAAALEARLSTLTIRAPAGQNVEIRRDGVTVRPGELNSAIPLDPGEHTVEASAPGMAPWSRTIQVPDGKAALNIDVPQLTSSEIPLPTSRGELPVLRLAVPPDKPRDVGSKQRTVALIVGGAGVVGVGIGTVFGLQASANWSNAKLHCSSYPYGCDSEGIRLHSSTISKSNVSTVAFIAGGAALAVSAVLWFTADTGSQANVAVGFGPGAAYFRGRF